MKILIFGSNGLVGSSLKMELPNILSDVSIRSSTRKDTDLFSLQETKKIISDIKPDIVINAAAKVGGIHANNTQRTEFILDNLKININILESLIPFSNIKLINLGSSCIYPLGAKIPIQENSLLSGKLEPTNSPYAMAKLTAIEMGDALTKQHGHQIINLMPTNLYGPNDNFSETSSHVIPGLIARMHRAKLNSEQVFKVWGTGKPLREFLHVNDLTNAIGFIIQNNLFSEQVLNVGSNQEISINDLVIEIKNIINYQGEIIFDDSMPDGNPRKLLDSSKLNKYGWESKIKLSDGLKNVYDWYVNNLVN
jgi:GDP-L-fucose synthase